MIANSYSVNDIETEIKKCQLLCIHCHKLKTIEDNGYYLYIQYETGMTRKDIRNNRINDKPLNNSYAYSLDGVKKI